LTPTGRKYEPTSIKLYHYRTVTRLEDDGRRIVHRQYTAGEGGRERLVMELILTKKDKGPSGGK
jgi:hypothetical protein